MTKGEEISAAIRIDAMNGVEYNEGLYAKEIDKAIGFKTLCPKCQGQGIVSKPPWVPAGVSEWSTTSTSFTCDVCNGNKLI